MLCLWKITFKWYIIKYVDIVLIFFMVVDKILRYYDKMKFKEREEIFQNRGDMKSLNLINLQSVVDIIFKFPYTKNYLGG